MINIAICDDDKVILSEIKNLLLNIAEKNFIKIDVNYICLFDYLFISP